MGGTKCLRLGTCELECMGGVLQNDSSIRSGAVISLGAPRPSFLCRNTREGLERKVSPLKTSHVTGYGRCEELFTLFFSFMKTGPKTPHGSR